MWATVFFPVYLQAQETTLPYGFDPKLEVKVIEQRNNLLHAQINNADVFLKSTILANVSAAAEMAKVEYANVFHLYDERGNPYQGQISQLIVCDPKLKPRRENVSTRAGTVAVIYGGANSRFVLGACKASEITHWSAYFNLVDRKRTSVLSVRAFTKIANANATSLNQAGAKLKSLIRQLFKGDDET